MSVPEKIEANLAGVATKANVHFHGKVISRNVWFTDGSKQTLGLMFPGTYTFGTEKKEKMCVMAGSGKVKLKDEADFKTYSAGEHWFVDANSSFDVEVSEGFFEYCCHYLDA
ncbi:unnamed protein product [Polarella glacialis]|uniref:Uncharacterized protein n=1 Tax=Polarella glacialis TaxID=89957 RepID=A0A813JB97_POLGL|nr:unnamed protein product [Polarella glacialis]